VDESFSIHDGNGNGNGNNNADAIHAAYVSWI
jgi:hypothetical protein